jgi:hypothetical protein
MNTMPAPLADTAGPRWPAPAHQAGRGAGPDLVKLEEILDQAAAATAAADQWALAITLGRCLGKLLASMDATPGDERLCLKDALILSNYNVTEWAHIASRRRR